MVLIFPLKDAITFMGIYNDSIFWADTILKLRRSNRGKDLII
jgi:hypothetical protein